MCWSALSVVLQVNQKASVTTGLTRAEGLQRLLRHHATRSSPYVPVLTCVLFSVSKILLSPKSVILQVTPRASRVLPLSSTFAVLRSPCTTPMECR
jgi:hypothetical protein